ncbi:YgiT-type zinc finger protein [Candidatus Poribacteria bacterium]|nr:YgiT-type zinc finger protein [Candidatus Poribacteria bacterium]
MMSKDRKCPECKGVVQPGRTELVYELANIKITVKNVPANVCSQCGQSFISGRVAEDVNRLVNRVIEDINSFVKTQPQVGGGHKEVAIAV